MSGARRPTTRRATEQSPSVVVGTTPGEPPRVWPIGGRPSVHRPAREVVMEGIVDGGEDHVVDLVVEVQSRGVDVDALARTVVLPGIEVLRTSGAGMIWLTALVNAPDPHAAIQQVQDAVSARLDGGRVVVATVATSVPLDELYARLDGSLTDRQLDGLDLFDLVEATLWNQSDEDGRDHAAGHRGRPGRLSNSA